jgi:maleamate amidohydrolase
MPFPGFRARPLQSEEIVLSGIPAMPSELREALRSHLQRVRDAYWQKGWGRRVGFGERPAVVVVDLANAWTDRKHASLDGDLDAVVLHTRAVLDAARGAKIPVFFTTMAYGVEDPIFPTDRKHPSTRSDTMAGERGPELDPRLGRRPNEKIIVKKYGSAFKGTDLHEMLAALNVDTLIVAGCSTSHCIYATCREATGSLRVIVPEETVGDRCDLFHEVFLADIDIGVGDVMPARDVIACLELMAATPQSPASGPR